MSDGAMLPEPLWSDLLSEVHQHIGDDGTDDATNDWATDLLVRLTPHLLRWRAEGDR